MSGRPSATSIALAIRNFASQPVGPLARADAPLTGHAGPMFGPAGRPTTGSHVLSARETVLLDNDRTDWNATYEADCCSRAEPCLVRVDSRRCSQLLGL